MLLSSCTGEHGPERLRMEAQYCLKKNGASAYNSSSRSLPIAYNAGNLADAASGGA
jgi:hypothetical protein